MPVYKIEGSFIKNKKNHMLDFNYINIFKELNITDE